MLVYQRVQRCWLPLVEGCLQLAATGGWFLWWVWCPQELSNMQATMQDLPHPQRLMIWIRTDTGLWAPCGVMAAYPHLCYVKMCCQRISCCQGICSCHQSDQSVPRHSKLQDEKNSREDSQNMVWLLTGITPRFSKWSQKSTSVCFLRGRAGFGINWTLWFFEGFSWGAPSCPAGERL